VAEEGSRCQFKAAIACSSPYNLELSSKLLQNSFVGREVYLRVMGTALKTLVRTHKKELEEYSTLDLEAIDRTTYLTEFDREVQCPSWGYPSVYAYYRDASSSDAILAIRIPFLAIHATDDPIAVKEAIPYDEFRTNPNTVLVTTSLGGHLCWFETGGTRWHSRAVPNFLNYFAFELDLDDIEAKDDASITDKKSRGAQFDPMRRRLAVPE
jgi:predicted alpha/beta-fold hydrolase